MVHADAALASQFIEDRVVDVNTIAAETSIVDAINAANRSHQHMSEEAIASRIQNVAGGTLQMAIR